MSKSTLIFTLFLVPIQVKIIIKNTSSTCTASHFLHAHPKKTSNDLQSKHTLLSPCNCQCVKPGVAGGFMARGILITAVCHASQTLMMMMMMMMMMVNCRALQTFMMHLGALDLPVMTQTYMEIQKQRKMNPTGFFFICLCHPSSSTCQFRKGHHPK